MNICEPVTQSFHLLAPQELPAEPAEQTLDASEVQVGNDILPVTTSKTGGSADQDRFLWIFVEPFWSMRSCL